ncbi:hypothetical protein P5673_008595 [Acropora cervicornis]|uniref:Uncharacterized protein n=1 Tax=Acropora cervicornis TaxID=6130 RepID=A0AAD9QV88_ACRCE|nr:hypothetical protein P5673_008595 [Acropora cervicornis]
MAAVDAKFVWLETLRNARKTSLAQDASTCLWRSEQHTEGEVSNKCWQRAQRLGVVHNLPIIQAGFGKTSRQHTSSHFIQLNRCRSTEARVAARNQNILSFYIDFLPPKQTGDQIN